jgi:H+/Cl- antiporter ClcA
MTLVQQITFTTFPLAALIAMFGGWFAYQLSLAHVRKEDDFHRLFLQVMVAGCVILIFFIVIITNTTFEKLIQLGY